MICEPSFLQNPPSSISPVRGSRPFLRYHFFLQDDAAPASVFFCLTRPIPQASSITAFPLVQASAASVEWTLVPVWQSGRRGRGKLASFQLEAKATPPNVDFFRRSDPVWSTLLFIKNTCIYFIVMTWTWFSWLGFHEKEHPLNWKCSF